MPSTRLLRATLLAGAFLVAAPAAAHAQLGGLAKRAAQRALEKKAEKTVVDKTVGDESPSCRRVEFDRTTVELTPERLDKIIAALESAYSGSAGTKRKALRSDLDAAEARLQELEADPNVQKAEDAQREYRSCRQEAFQEVVSKRVEQEGQGIMTKYMQAMRVHNEKIAAAQAKGDTARANALTDSTWQVMTQVVQPTSADSAMVDRKCGKPPRPSRRAAERDSLRTAVREMNDELRSMDEDLEDGMLRKTGLTAAQFAMAKERLVTFVKQKRTCGFTKGEADGISERKDKLDALL
jgi:hypothetical protein